MIIGAHAILYSADAEADDDAEGLAAGSVRSAGWASPRAAMIP